MKILSSPPTDVITKTAMTMLTAPLSDEVDVFYLWACATPVADIAVTKSKNIIAVKDTLGQAFVTGRMPYAEDLVKMAQSNLDKKFVFVLSMENVEHTFAECTNVKVIHMGGDWLNELELYADMPPVADKNFDSNRTTLSLNRNPRFHRMINVSYLHATGIRSNSVISYLHTDLVKHESILDAVPWDFGKIDPVHRQMILDGFLQLKENTAPADSYDIYKDIGLIQNTSNFARSLREKYRSSFVELVTETTFAEPAIHLTEKTLHAFLGYNFPIVLGSVGTVEFLRNLGFDMFDDVVDHTYDTDPDPVGRVVNAINSNYHLLASSDFAIARWKACKARFDSNWQLVRSGQLAQWYTARLEKQFAQSVKEWLLSD